MHKSIYIYICILGKVELDFFGIDQGTQEQKCLPPMLPQSLDGPAIFFFNC